MESRGPSAEAMAAVAERLDQALGEVGTRKAAQVGEELFSVAAVLRSTPSLRRVLTDVSVQGEAKQTLVRELLGGKVDDVSLDLTAEAAGQRWTNTRDLADAVERLSEMATVRSAGDNVDRVVDELFSVSLTIDGDPELRNALSDPTRSAADREALVDDLLAGKALTATVTLVKHSLTGSYRSVGVALAAYQQVAARIQEQRVATVHVAQPLSAPEQERLEAALTRQYGRAVHLNVLVDPELIGGVRVEIGDDVIDGTVAARLDHARRKLAG
jgi:F-type H+-transporting ATPase subunit delta